MKQLFVKTSDGLKSLNDIDEFTLIEKNAKQCVAHIRGSKKKVLVYGSLGAIEKKLKSKGLLL